MQKTLLLISLSAVALLGTSVLSANATTGPGCLRVVNVSPNDVLNMRQKPSASSRIVDQLKPEQHGIIKLEGQCTPLSLSWGSRWCPITHYNDSKITKGWVKARYVRDNDCP